MKNKYTEKLKVDSTLIDFQGKMPLTQMLRICGMVTFNHADKVGLDHVSIYNSSNAFWVVTKMKLEIKDYPLERDKLSVTTWAHHPGIIRFDRDYLMKIGSKVCIKGTAEWCCLDADSRKVRKASTIAFPDLEQIDQRAVKAGYTTDKIDMSDEDYMFTHKVRATDIDLNQHTNNLRYSYFTFDTFTVDELKGMNIRDYEIHFVNETVEGDEIDIYKKKIKKNFYYIEGKTKDKLVYKVFMKMK